MKHTFRLKDPQSESETVIYLDIAHNRKRIKYYTGYSIHPELWNHEDQRSNPSKYTKNKFAKRVVGLTTKLQNLNTALEDILRACQDYTTESRLKGKSISSKDLREYLKASFKKDASFKTLFFVDYLENHYLPKLIDGTITYKKNGQLHRYRPATIKAKKQALNAFTKYEKETHTRIRFDDIDMNFYDTFVSHYLNDGMSTNYIGRLVKELKTILRRTYHEGLHNNKVFENRDFSTLHEDVNTVYLTQEELNALEALQLKGMDKIYRDAFLIGCYTAMRFSDFSQLDKSNISSCGKYLQKHSQKTGTEVVIPLHPFVKQTLMDKKYQNKNTLYPQKLNTKIKKFAKDVGITQEVEIKTNKKGKTVYMNVPKYKKITTHTARRTGATLLYLADVPSMDIMKITGHKTEKSFLKYIRVTPKETAQRLAKSTFFNPSPLKAVK